MRSEPLETSVDDLAVLNIPDGDAVPLRELAEASVGAGVNAGVSAGVSVGVNANASAGVNADAAPDADAATGSDASTERGPASEKAGDPAMGRAAAASSSAAPARSKTARFFGEVPLMLVICGVGLGLIVIALHHFRWGSLAISLAVLLGALFRLVLPTRKAGLLAVRTRFIDVVTAGLIGGTLLVLAAVTSS